VSSNTPLDPAFVDLCLAFRKDESHSPVYPSDTGTFVSPTSVNATNIDPETRRLTDSYPHSYSDFFPSRAPCVYKSGPAWEVRTGPQAQGIVREVRPVYRPDIAPSWVSTLQRIYEYLDTMGVRWTSINPLAYANEGEAIPFCAFIVSVGVTPCSLAYEDAVAAAGGVKEILAKSGLAGVEVAFVESVVERSVGLKLLSFNPQVPEPRRYFTPIVAQARKNFTAVLGLSIAPLKTPHYGGTGALFFRLSSKDDRVAVLTCAHVARPPPVFPANKGMTHTHDSQPREHIVALGTGGYNGAISDIIHKIGALHRDIDVWNGTINRLPKPTEGENPNVTDERKEYTDLVERATRDINTLNALYGEVTMWLSTPELRVIGHVLHVSPIQVLDQPGYTEDWSLILVDRAKIDWDTFLGNKVFVGTSFRFSPWLDTPFLSQAFFLL